MGIVNSLKVLIKPSPTTQPDQEKTAIINTPPKKILIIEDDQSIRQLYYDILKAEGFDVMTAENGQIGLEMIKAQKPDGVLLDLMMPVMNGRELLHDLRQIPEFVDLPVIVLTNAGDIDSMQEAKRYYDVRQFLIKSNITPQDVIDSVKGII